MTCKNCLPIRLLSSTFNKVHDHCHTDNTTAHKTHSNITSLFLKHASPFSIMTVLKVNVTIILTKKIKQLQYNPFLNIILLSNTDFHRIQKVLSILLHRMNLTYMSFWSHILLVILLSLFLSNLTILQLLLNHLFIIGLSNLVYLYILLLIVDPNTLMRIWHNSVLLWNRHSPRPPYSHWTNGLVEVQNKNLGTHLGIFPLNNPKD